MKTAFVRGFALVMLVMAMLAPVSIAAQDATPAATPLASPVAGQGLPAAVEWLVSQQQEDGSWLGFSGEADAGTTVDAIVALGAAREAGINVDEPLDLALAWLGSESVAADYVNAGTGQAAKLVLALVAAGAESLEIGGVAPLDMLQDGQAAETGLYGTGLYDHAYVLMALAATGSDIPQNAIDFLATVQATNGGFAWDGSTDETMVDSNTTAMIVQALIAAGVPADDPVVAGAVGYLRLVVSDQGASYSVGAEADANSTALVAQALALVRDDVTHLITALTHFQNTNGAYHWMHNDPADNLFSTIQVIPAVADVSLPVVPGAFDMNKVA